MEELKEMLEENSRKNYIAYIAQEIYIHQFNTLTSTLEAFERAEKFMEVMDNWLTREEPNQ